ncbi:ribonuclease P protein subunit p14 [Anopheles ziemanni]|uniref:ribonuclease P protein subunit p14 n=1 Tax=Anopheles coustani TaxID=139045 RepID=UPI0026592BD0|nr:ribonuclease P protein subunit p14 [Anopheles coustani]XP_058172405.1 ribonuclease P protein subunit p14 [Anopheles ziemanni]
MTEYFYFDIEIKLAKEPDQLIATKVKSRIQGSLNEVFGEIGGQTELDLLKFDPKRRRIILRVPQAFYVKLRAAITFIAEFQGVPCNFLVRKASPVLLSLAETHLQF